MNEPPEGAPVADDLMTMGEVARTLARLDKRIENGMAGLSEQLTLMRGEFLHRAEWETVQRGQREHRIEMEREHADYEARLRIIEAKPTVSPKQLWAGFVSAVGVGAVIAPLIRVFA